MRSVGLDTTAGSGGTSAGDPLYRAIPDLEAVKGFDLMSYCNITRGDPAHWISARNWNRLIDVAAVEGTRLKAKQPSVAGPALTVRGRVDDGAASIVSVHPVDDSRTSPGSPSPYTLVALDASGGVVASTAMTQNVVHGAVGAPDFTQLQASVPVGRIAQVQVMHAGAVVAERAASAHAPTVSVSSPRQGPRIDPRRPLTVRWTAVDADSSDALEATVQISTDGGSSYRSVAGGANTGSATLVARTLAASPQARLRVRVDDGFSVTVSKAVRIVAEHSPPQVTISEPVARQRIAAGSSVYLRGGATDDRGRQIPGPRLRWIAGDGRELGRGQTLSAVLPPGTRSVRLTAVDAAGRRAAASVALQPEATTPFFLRLDAPSKLSRAARSITLRVASTQSARLRIGSRGFSVSPKTTRIRLSIRPGRSKLSLMLVLSAGGKRTEQVVVIPRR
jgi:hypothetical protein